MRQSAVASTGWEPTCLRMLLLKGCWEGVLQRCKLFKTVLHPNQGMFSVEAGSLLAQEGAFKVTRWRHPYSQLKHSSRISLAFNSSLKMNFSWCLFWRKKKSPVEIVCGNEWKQERSCSGEEFPPPLLPSKTILLPRWTTNGGSNQWSFWLPVK